MTAERLHEIHNRIWELSTERVQRCIACSLLRLVGRVGVTENQGAIRIDMRLSRQGWSQVQGIMQVLPRLIANKSPFWFLIK